MSKKTEQKPLGIIITNSDDAEKFNTFEGYILGTFYGRDFTETMTNTSLEYFRDHDVAHKICEMFNDELFELADHQLVQDVINGKISSGTIDREDYTYYFNVQMAIDAVSEICSGLDSKREQIAAQPNKLLTEILKEAQQAREKGGR